MIEIRKYSNRRLYDTSTSQYVTLSDVAQMIRDGVELRVVDAKSSEDLTRAVMLQIICESKFEQEALPINFLRTVIQASSKTVRTSIKDFLTAGMSAQKEVAHWVRLGAMANPLVAPFVAAWEGISKNDKNGQAMTTSANGAGSHGEAPQAPSTNGAATHAAAQPQSLPTHGEAQQAAPANGAATKSSPDSDQIELLQAQLQAMQQQIEALRDKSN